VAAVLLGVALLPRLIRPGRRSRQRET
jgi:hypothetical protein